MIAALAIWIGLNVAFVALRVRATWGRRLEFDETTGEFVVVRRHGREP